MSVNKFKFKVSGFGKNNSLKLPFLLNYNNAGQSEVINDEFVMNEVDKSINKIIDYEKVRFAPKLSNGNNLENLTINLNFLKDGSYKNSTYADIGFFDDDILFNKNKFKNSFLRLSFYDSDVPTNQNLISFITIFSKSGDKFTSANELNVNFRVNNPITNPEGFAEGFYIYHYKSEVLENSPQNIYMRAEFNNASTGKTTKFMTSNELLDINNVIKKLHNEYLLTKTSTGYYYTVNKNYNNSNNITESSNNLKINLYEIRVK